MAGEAVSPTLTLRLNSTEAAAAARQLRSSLAELKTAVAEFSGTSVNVDGLRRLIGEVGSLGAQLRTARADYQLLSRTIQDESKKNAAAIAAETAAIREKYRVMRDEATKTAAVLQRAAEVASAAPPLSTRAVAAARQQVTTPVSAAAPATGAQTLAQNEAIRRESLASLRQLEDEASFVRRRIIDTRRQDLEAAGRFQAQAEQLRNVPPEIRAATGVQQREEVIPARPLQAALPVQPAAPTGPSTPVTEGAAAAVTRLEAEIRELNASLRTLQAEAAQSAARLDQVTGAATRARGAATAGLAAAAVAGEAPAPAALPPAQTALAQLGRLRVNNREVSAAEAAQLESFLNLRNLEGERDSLRRALDEANRENVARDLRRTAPPSTPGFVGPQLPVPVIPRAETALQRAGATQARAELENEARERRLGVTQVQAAIEDEQRTRREGITQYRAIAENEQRERRLGVAQSLAQLQNEARDRRLGVQQARAEAENAARDAAAGASAQRAGVTQARAELENEARDRRLGVQQVRAAAEDEARMRREGVTQYRALAENERLTRQQGVTQALAELQNEARDRRLGVQQVRAAEEDERRTRSLGVVQARAEMDERRRLAAERRELNRQARLDTNFLTAPEESQTRTARRAQVFSQLRGEDEAVREFGRAAVTAGSALGPSDADTGRVRRHTTATRELAQAQREIHSVARGLSGALGGLWLTYGSIVPIAAGFAIASSLREAVQAGTEFQFQMTFVRQLTGDTAEGVRGASEAIQQMATRSLFGPLQLAEAMRILAQAGFNTRDSLLALPAVMDLATVGELKVEDAALSAAGAMNAFGLSIADIPRVTDVIAKAAAISQTSVGAMNESLKQASSVAQQFNVDLETTGAVLVLLAQRNIIGSAAGTAFRNMMTNLVADTRHAREEMARLGVSMFDAQGQFKDLFVFVDELRQALSKFTPQEQAISIGRLTTERGRRALDALLNAQFDPSRGIDEARQIREQLRGSGGFGREVALELETQAKGELQKAINSFNTALIVGFGQAEDTLTNFAITLRSVFTSPEFASGIATLLQAFASLTQTLVENGREVLLLVAAYGSLKILQGVTGTIARAAATIADLTAKKQAAVGATNALATAQTTLANTSRASAAAQTGIATALGVLHTGASGVSTGVGKLTRGLSVFAGLLGVGGVIYLGVTTLIDLFDNLGAAGDKASQRIDNLGKRLNSQLNDQIAAAKQRAAILEAGGNPDDPKSAQQALLTSGIGQLRAEAARATKEREAAQAELRRLQQEGEAASLTSTPGGAAVLQPGTRAGARLSGEQRRGLAEAEAQLKKTQELEQQALDKVAELDDLKLRIAVGESQLREREQRERGLKSGTEKMDRPDDSRGAARAAIDANKLVQAESADLLAGFRQKEQVVDQFVKQELEVLEVQKRFGLIRETEYQTEVDRLTAIRLNGLAQISAAEESFLREKLNDPRLRAEDGSRQRLETQLAAAQARREKAQADARQNDRIRDLRIQGEHARDLEEATKLRAKLDEDRNKLVERQQLQRQQESLKVESAVLPTEEVIRREAILETEKDFLNEKLDLQRQIAALERSSDPGDQIKLQVLRDTLPLLEKQRTVQAQLNAEEAVANFNRQREFVFGWQQAFKEYTEAATNAAQKSRDVFGVFTQSLEDFAAEAATTGKLNFQKLADTIIAELARIQAKAAIGEILKGLGATPGGAPAFGGAVGTVLGGGGLLSGVGGILSGGFNPAGIPGAPEFVGPVRPGEGLLGGLIGSVEKLLSGIFHTGGVVGHESPMSRMVDPEVFRGAPRMHIGGIAGNEVPIIAQKGEGVFTPAQMRALAPVQGMSGPQKNITVNTNITVPQGTPGQTAQEIALRTGLATQRVLARHT